MDARPAHPLVAYVVAHALVLVGALGLGAALASTGCSGADPILDLGRTDDAASGSSDRACVPGQQVACACSAQETGVQTCNAAGTAYGACLGCAASDASSGSSADASSGDSTGDANVGSMGDAAGDAGHTVVSGPGFDGTTGLACSSDADCSSPHGAGANRCSSDFAFAFGALDVSLYSPPVCIVTPVVQGGLALGGDCDPAPASDPSGSTMHFCDGPDAAASPGLCLPNTVPTLSGQGLCLPKCTFAVDGAAPGDCPSNEACVGEFFTLNPGDSGVVGYGVCEGICRTTADCAPLGAGYTCQTDVGLCTQAPIQRTSALGDACAGASTAACSCSAGASGSGYCAKTCVVGASDCPGGWVCDADEPAIVDFGIGQVFPIAQPTPGLLGTCFQRCNSMGAGSSQCPSNSACSNASAAGPDCLPQ